MIRDTRPQDATGMFRVGTIVQGRAKHGWQPYDQRNDNGVDGIIIKRRKGIDTGEIVFVQVKCGTGNGYFKATLNRPKHFGVNVGQEYLNTHKPRWHRLFGAVILVYVDYKTEKAWWTDLKDEKSYTDDNKSIILVPKEQRFGEHSFGGFRKLKGFLHIDPELKDIKLKDADVSYFNLASKTQKEAAKEYYKNWSASRDRINPILGEVIVSREGWRHISRKGRRPDRITQSWTLLGAAKAIIAAVDKANQLRQEKSILDKMGNYVITDYISLRAQILFPNRHSSIVQVILIRKRKLNSSSGTLKSEIRFHSVYEPLKGKRIR